MATGGFARAEGQPSRVVRVMDPAASLAHKLAAWNERRLLRDLYDCYFLSARVGAEPDLEILQARLQAVRSRLPRLRRIRSMSLEQFVRELRLAVVAITDARVAAELAPLLPPEEEQGLVLRLRAALSTLCDRILPTPPL